MEFKKCEFCSLENSKVETLTLCPTCFHLFNSKMEVLILENHMLRSIFLKLFFKGEKKEEEKDDNKK